MFALLAEDVGLPGPPGWFSVPWRDGRYAMGLVAALAYRVAQPLTLAPALASRLHAALTLSEQQRDVYWVCDDLRDEAYYVDLPPTLQTLAIMRLRMLQLLVSNSHGGGHGYNTVLLGSWHKLVFPDALPVAEIVQAQRASDAVGVADARRRAAFKAAWAAGLYRAAYALGPR